METLERAGLGRSFEIHARGPLPLRAYASPTADKRVHLRERGEPTICLVTDIRRRKEALCRSRCRFEADRGCGTSPRRAPHSQVIGGPPTKGLSTSGFGGSTQRPPPGGPPPDAGP